MTRRALPLFRAATLFAAATGCFPEAPAAPSFQVDVQPILAANCVRCHGYPRLAGPADMRLDSYIDTEAPPDVVFGAGTYAQAIAASLVGDGIRMPPRFPLEAYQIETITRWVGGLAVGEVPPRGEPRPGNLPPAVQVTRLDQVGAVIRFHYELRDPDGDLVGGELRAVVGATELVIAALHSGRDEVTWDTTGLSGEAALVVVVDDGGETFRIDALARVPVGAP